MDGEHDWVRAYSAECYVEMLQTHQDHILLAPELRTALLERVAEAIERRGGIEMAYRTVVCLARREPEVPA